MAFAERKFRVVNKLGLHARAAAKLVKEANRYRCDVHVERDGQSVNGKSIMGVLMLAAALGSELVVRTEGPDAADALDALGKLIDDGFGEELG